jgi:hypothetical protein
MLIYLADVSRDRSGSSTAGAMAAEHPRDPQQDGHDNYQHDKFTQGQKDGFMRHHANSSYGRRS